MVSDSDFTYCRYCTKSTRIIVAIDGRMCSTLIRALKAAFDG